MNDDDVAHSFESNSTSATQALRTAQVLSYYASTVCVCVGQQRWAVLQKKRSYVNNRPVGSSLPPAPVIRPRFGDGACSHRSRGSKAASHAPPRESSCERWRPANVWFARSCFLSLMLRGALCGGVRSLVWPWTPQRAPAAAAARCRKQGAHVREERLTAAKAVAAGEVRRWSTSHHHHWGKVNQVSTPPPPRFSSLSSISPSPLQSASRFSKNKKAFDQITPLRRYVYHS